MSDLGEKIFCRVIGSNIYGADTAYTNVVGPVGGLDVAAILTTDSGTSLTDEDGEFLTVELMGEVLTAGFGEPLTTAGAPLTIPLAG